MKRIIGLVAVVLLSAGIAFGGYGSKGIRPAGSSGSSRTPTRSPSYRSNSSNDSTAAEAARRAQSGDKYRQANPSPTQTQDTPTRSTKTTGDASGTRPNTTNTTSGARDTHYHDHYHDTVVVVPQGRHIYGDDYSYHDYSSNSNGGGVTLHGFWVLCKVIFWLAFIGAAVYFIAIRRW